MHGEEKEAANLFRQLLRQSIRVGLLEVMAEEVSRAHLVSGSGKA